MATLVSSLDRGEFDEDNSGGGKLYVGVFDRKLHLAGAEWGAWTVDKNAEYHGGVKTPSPKPLAPRVEEVVKYTDTDNNGFLDTVEYDYDGDRTIDFSFHCLIIRVLLSRTPTLSRSSTLIRKVGRVSIPFHFDCKPVVSGGTDCLQACVATWPNSPGMDKLASAGAIGERYDHGYWLKEKVFDK
jgi:hypothetical protein